MCKNGRVEDGSGCNTWGRAVGFSIRNPTSQEVLISGSGQGVAGCAGLTCWFYTALTFDAKANAKYIGHVESLIFSSIENSQLD